MMCKPSYIRICTHSGIIMLLPRARPPKQGAVWAEMLAGVKLLQHYAPAAMHAVGGVMDDLFSAILPDASQSRGDRSLPFRQRCKKAWGVMKGGLASLPLAMALGWGSAILYAASPSPWLRAAAGVAFAQLPLLWFTYVAVPIPRQPAAFFLILQPRIAQCL